MPFVTIEWFEGRSDDQKRDVAEKVTEVLAEVGKVPAEQVWVRFTDVSRSDWAIGGEIQGDAPTEGADAALGPPE